MAKTPSRSSKQTEKEAEAAAEAAHREALDELEAAAERAAEAGQGLVAAKMRGIPDMVVEVLPGNHISHNDQAYYGEGYPFAPEGHTGNDTLELPGPTALALTQQGAIRIKGASE